MYFFNFDLFSVILPLFQVEYASIILLMWNIVDDKKGLKVEKNRQGILSTEVLRFDGDNMQFIETDESIKEAAKGFRKAEEPTPFD